jgi:hypothetical protein
VRVLAAVAALLVRLAVVTLPTNEAMQTEVAAKLLGHREAYYMPPGTTGVEGTSLNFRQSRHFRYAPPPSAWSTSQRWRPT